MANVLFFGDSLTWGFNPVDDGRYSVKERFTGIIDEMFSDFYVIAEGMKGRTTVFEDGMREGRNGRKALTAILYTHAPLDIVVVMLGVNDVKTRFMASPQEITKGMQLIIETIEAYSLWGNSKKPEILIISPPTIREDMTGSNFEGIYGMDGAKKVQMLSVCYEKLAKARGCYFLDASKICSAEHTDGVHIDAEGHLALAGAIAKKLVEMIDGKEL